MTAVQREAGMSLSAARPRDKSMEGEREVLREGPDRRFERPGSCPPRWTLRSRAASSQHCLRKERLERTEQAMAVPKLVKVEEESCVL